MDSAGWDLQFGKQCWWVTEVSCPFPVVPFGPPLCTAQYLLQVNSKCMLVDCYYGMHWIRSILWQPNIEMASVPSLCMEHFTKTAVYLGLLSPQILGTELANHITLFIMCAFGIVWKKDVISLSFSLSNETDVELTQWVLEHLLAMLEGLHAGWELCAFPWKAGCGAPGNSPTAGERVAEVCPTIGQF